MLLFCPIHSDDAFCALLPEVKARIKLPKSAILVSMDVTNLYKNIPQREGITTVCYAYEEFHQGNPPVPTRFLSEMLV